jgi:hypothetical protein
MLFLFYLAELLMLAFRRNSSEESIIHPAFNAQFNRRAQLVLVETDVMDLFLVVIFLAVSRKEKSSASHPVNM